MDTNPTTPDTGADNPMEPTAPWATQNDTSQSGLLLNMPDTDTTASTGDINAAIEPPSSFEPDGYANDAYKSSSSATASDSTDSTESSDKTSSTADDLSEESSPTQPLINVSDCTDTTPRIPSSQQSSRRSSIEHGRKMNGSLPNFDENGITHVTIEEVSPKPLTIANKLTIADEYFLHSSQNSLSSFRKRLASNGFKGSKDTNKGSFLSIASSTRMGKAVHNALLQIRDEQAFASNLAVNTAGLKELEEKHVIVPGEEHVPVVASSKYMKNILMISVCVFLNFVALGSVRNLQSSINHEGGIGVISMAVSFLGYMFASMFSTVIVQSIQPHKIFVAHLIPHFLYVASNIYPAPWLLAPVSFFQGMSLAIGWNSMSTYVTLLSAGEAKLKNKDYSHTSGKFFGIFGLFFQAYFIVGNLIASLVLTFANSPPPSQDNNHVAASTTSTSGLILSGDNVTSTSANYSILGSSNITTHDKEQEDYLHLCGAKYWQHYDLGGAALYVSDETKFLLYGLYMACVVSAIVLSIFYIEPLNLHYFDRSKSTCSRLKRHFAKLTMLWVNPKFLLLVPLMMYSFMEVGFATAEITKAFVTCPIGIHMVGWTMMFLGICGSVSSYAGGLLTKRIGRTSQLITACLCNILVLVVMVFWTPTRDSYVPYFALVGLWGASDGIWVAHINSLVNTVFPKKYEEAFSGLRMCQGIGVAVVFGYSNSLSMLAKIYVTGIFCLFALVLYIIHTVIYRPDSVQGRDTEVVVDGPGDMDGETGA